MADLKSHLVRYIDEIAVNDFKEVDTDLRGIWLACWDAPIAADVADFETAGMRPFIARRR